MLGGLRGYRLLSPELIDAATRCSYDCEDCCRCQGCYVVTVCNSPRLLTLPPMFHHNYTDHFRCQVGYVVTIFPSLLMLPPQCRSLQGPLQMSGRSRELPSSLPLACSCCRTRYGSAAWTTSRKGKERKQGRIRLPCGLRYRCLEPPDCPLIVNYQNV